MLGDIRKRLKRYEPRVTNQAYHNPDRGQAAVLLPIVVSPNNPALVLTVRSAGLSSHASEVAWPGGKQDAGDPSLLATALRETEEEIGIDPTRVQIIGELRPFLSKFGLLVTPFVGLIEADAQLIANPAEIETIFQFPLKDLLGDPRSRTNVIERNGERYITPEYEVEGYRVWGLTAMILADFMIHGMGMDFPHPVD